MYHMAKIIAYIPKGSSPDGNLHVAIIELKKNFNQGTLIELSLLSKEKKGH